MVFVDECTSQRPKLSTVSFQTLPSVDTLVIYKHSVYVSKEYSTCYIRLSIQVDVKLHLSPAKGVDFLFHEAPFVECYSLLLSAIWWLHKTLQVSTISMMPTLPRLT